MPTPTDLYLDTFQLHSLDTFLPTSVSYPLSGLESPDIRLSSYNNPGSHGQTVSNALYGGRIVALQGTVRGDDVETYRANKQALSQAVGLQNDTSGFPIARTFKLALGDGKVYQLPVITSKFRNPEQYSTRSVWQLELTATQWFLESDTQSSASVGLPQAGGSVFPWEFPLIFSGGGGGTITVTNNGTVTSHPTITLAGPVTNPVISNSTTGERIALNITLLTGDSLVINTQDRTIIQGGATNRIGVLMTGSSFWGLAPGANIVTYSANQYDTSTATLVWNDAIGGI